MREDVGASLRDHFWVAQAAWEGLSCSSPGTDQHQTQVQPDPSVTLKAHALVREGLISIVCVFLLSLALGLEAAAMIPEKTSQFF